MVWVLTETVANPSNAQTEFYGGGGNPVYFGEERFDGKFTKYTVSESGLGIQDREVDHGYEYHNVSVSAALQEPPAEMVPGQTIELTATFAHSGSVSAGGLGIGVLFWYSGKGLQMQPAEPFRYAPWDSGFDGTSSVTYTSVIPWAAGGEELEIYASFWNAEPCLVIWRYEARPAGGAAASPEPEQADDGEEPPLEAEPRRPVIVLPGIYGSYVASVWSEGTWLYGRGIAPELLTIDPLAHSYDDLIQTLKNAGYVEGQDLFVGAYDWRMPPGPVDGAVDGVIEGLSGVSITDDVYEYGIDYLGYYLEQAAESWRQNHDGEALDSVDIISHSTGGLVARVYIQGTAYGKHYRSSDGTAVALPRVNNLIMVAVPNRGATLPWQAMHNNFKRDVASKLVMSKIIARSYFKVQRGFTIGGPPLPITPESVRDPATGLLDPVKFIRLYCPTFRSLLATYPFLVKQDGRLVDVNNLPEVRNDLVLDLNNGLDLPDRPAPADPSPFAGAVNRTTVMWARRNDTVHQMREMNSAAENAVFPMDARFEQDVAAGTTWYEDIVEPLGGDGTVPSLSAAGQFEGDGRIDLVEVLPGDGSHTGLMANRRVQTLVLDILGIDLQGVEISTGLARTDAYVVVVMSDPVGLLLADGQGRRLGWTPDTGALSEIPNSLWYGESEGIGFAFGEVPQPLRVELVGLGGDHFVQVVGEQREQRIGLQDDSPLAAGERRILEIRAADEPDPGPLAPVEAPAPGKPATPWVTGATIAASALAAGALAVVGTRLMRKRRAPARQPGAVRTPVPAPAAACERCGSAVRPQGGFCGACGAPVAPAGPQAQDQPGRAEPAGGMLTCPHCSHRVSAGSRFCGLCGGPVSCPGKDGGP